LHGSQPPRSCPLHASTGSCHQSRLRQMRHGGTMRARQGARVRGRHSRCPTRAAAVVDRPTPAAGQHPAGHASHSGSGRRVMIIGEHQRS
jgi:hypothetical protein